MQRYANRRHINTITEDDRARFLQAIRWLSDPCLLLAPGRDAVLGGRQRQAHHAIRWSMAMQVFMTKRVLTDAVAATRA